MSTCKQNPEHLTLWVLGDLPSAEAKAVAQHVAECSACQRDSEELRLLLGNLRELKWEAPGEAFFAAQAEGILGDVDREEVEARRLAEELKELPLPDPGEAFFQRQAEAIQSAVLQETVVEDADLVALAGELRGIPVPDPGELFFRRQANEIQSQVLPEAPKKSWIQGVWVRPLAVAAALFFLVLGIYRIDQVTDRVGPMEWQTALRFLAEEAEPMDNFVEWDDLNDQQLDSLAGNMEQAMLIDVDETWVDEPADWEDLNGKELDQLIDRLEMKAKT